MSQNIDLSGPAAAECLRISHSLVSECTHAGGIPLLGTPEYYDWMKKRVESIAFCAEAILRVFAAAVNESNRKRIGDVDEP
jgi:hypothetical protein